MGVEATHRVTSSGVNPRSAVLASATIVDTSHAPGTSTTANVPTAITNAEALGGINATSR